MLLFVRYGGFLRRCLGFKSGGRAALFSWIPLLIVFFIIYRYVGNAWRGVMQLELVVVHLFRFQFVVLAFIGFRKTT
jgi:hypothetical protein